MGRSSAPPVNKDTVRAARIGKFLTQADVQRQCADLGVIVEQSTISKIENGAVSWPAPRLLPVLAEVLGLEVKALFLPPEGEEAAPEPTDGRVAA